MNTKYTFLIAIILSFCFTSEAQFGFEYDNSIPVYRDGDTLNNAWGGGLNYPQFSDFDYDFDGDMDLFIFDRSNNTIRVYTQEGTADKYYKLAYNSREHFPSDLKYRATLVDFDNDGRKDLFTYASGGLMVYRNVGDIGNGLQWELFDPVVESLFPSGVEILGVSSADIPAIVDVDFDGDIDVLTFNALGNRVEYHQNQSMDLYGIPDSLVFELKNECWGKFTENDLNNGIVLNDPNAPCVGGNIPNPERVAELVEDFDSNSSSRKHIGSSLLALDIDSSGVIDLLIGDASYSSLNLLTNSGSVVNADSPMMSVEYNFPSNSTPIKITLFPAAYLIDVDFDGVKDLVAAPNALNISFNESSVKFYKNIGTNGNPIFVYSSPKFLQDQMIEHGTGTIPTLFDVDEDGLKDLIVANFFRFKPIDSRESTLAYYRNVGTASAPEYQYIDYNYLDLSNQSYGLRTVPAFGDVDDDGDQDLFLGREDGTLVFYENQSVGSGAVWGTPTLNYTDNLGAVITAGQYNHPTLFDLNEDGLLDLILGTKTGELKYYENVGTANAPSFELMNDNLGNVNVAGGSTVGYAAPHFIEKDGEIHLFVGNVKGKLVYYDSIQNNLATGNTFNIKYSSYLGINVNGYSSFWVEDINADGNFNMFVGQDLGGLFHYEADSLSSITLDEISLNSNVAVYPNPTNENITIASTVQMKSYTMVDLNGRVMVNKNSSQFKEFVNMSSFPQGFYVISIELADGSWVTRKIIKED